LSNLMSRDMLMIKPVDAIKKRKKKEEEEEEEE
jgi:hypothetical protein